MKPTFAASLLAFTLVLMPTAALAASNSSVSNSRYFLQTTKSWCKFFGVRNTFDGGFTADLNDLQVKIAKFTGCKPIPVKSFNILDDASATVAPSATPTPQATPAAPVSWGISYILGNDSIQHTSGGDGITVAVLDTGIDTQHPDLAARIAKCADYADPSNAFIDKQCEDDNGHGTQVAGIIAADGGPSGTGIWGLAPGTDLLVYKVCNADGLCLSDDIAKAIVGAVDDGANIIVLAFGGEAESSFIDDALTYANAHDVLVVAAAGNDGPYDDSVDWPAHSPLVVSVGATASDGTVADFSSRGINATTTPYRADSGDIEVAAPGVNIESTYAGGGYAISSGTSMAVSYVAAVAAREWPSKSDHPADDVRTILHHMAQDLAPVGDDNASGWGVLTY